MLTAVITFADGDVDDTKKVGTIDGGEDDYTAGQALRVVVSATGSTGTQGQGVVVSVNVRENPAP